MNEIKHLTPFRFWVQKVIPLVYDESLSYYELLCKVIDYLNKMGVDFNALLDNFTEFSDDMTNKFNSLSDEFDELKEWAEHDLPVFVNDKLDEMAENGTLTALIAPYLPFITPQMFGAIGDGEHDDTSAFTAALATKKNVYVPEGNYILNDTLYLNSGQKLTGAGRLQSHLIFTATNGICIDADAGSKYCCEIANLEIKGALTNGIYFKSAGVTAINDYHYIHDMEIKNCVRGIYITGRTVSPKFERLQLVTNDYGFYANVILLNGSLWEHVSCLANNYDGAYIDCSTGSMTENTFLNCVFESNKGNGLQINGVTRAIELNSCWFEGNASDKAISDMDGSFDNYANIKFTGTEISDMLLLNNDLRTTKGDSIHIDVVKTVGGTIENCRFNDDSNVFLMFNCTASAEFPLKVGNNHIHNGKIFKVTGGSIGFGYPVIFEQGKRDKFSNTIIDVDCLLSSVYAFNTGGTLNIVNYFPGALLRIRCIGGDNSLTIPSAISNVTTINGNEAKNLFFEGYPTNKFIEI